jgi:hypothetical protein
LEVSGKLHAPAALLPGNNAGTRGIGEWVDPRTDCVICRREISLALSGFEARTLLAVTKETFHYILPLARCKNLTAVNIFMSRIILCFMFLVLKCQQATKNCPLRSLHGQTCDDIALVVDNVTCIYSRLSFALYPPVLPTFSKRDGRLN